VRITRRLDKVIGNQKANLLVDGVNAGVWGPLPAGQGWLFFAGGGLVFLSFNKSKICFLSLNGFNILNFYLIF
jgi:hypothetical protein